MYQVTKRDGSVAEFNINKISAAIAKAFEAMGKQSHPSVMDMLALRTTADFESKIQDGLIAVVMTIDSATGDVVAGPDIVSRGFVYVRESEPLIDDIKTVVSRVLDSYSRRDWATIKTKVRDELSRYLFDCTRRSPMILPIIMEI